ncbi:hypothetical protein SAMN06298224_0214 [Fibrobacter sp. UWB16]|uniref:hypothetical protein n=1 Tax=Fibrobacter sp. UWB16 TaxID=1945874 RepID=UPI000BD66CEB|nr:hypothetical protein [Fibrobacter sp. UWB16]SOD11523.1 hypothetical protein SAMN06298224_0214 [Fibrobacter sp. UWB16]
MISFIKGNTIIFVSFLLAIIVIGLYIQTKNVVEWFPHADEWFQVLFQLSIGFVVSFIFYVTQVYLPRRKSIARINQCICARIQDIVSWMNDVFVRLGKLYVIDFDEKKLTSECCMSILHSMRVDDRIQLINPSRLNLGYVDQEACYTIREWLTECVGNIELNIDKLLKYYSPYITPELMDAAERICKSTVHHNMVRMIFKMKNPPSFKGLNEDIFFKPYLHLMKELDKTRNQYL